jgi:MSHA pilin protein MshC
MNSGFSGAGLVGVRGFTMVELIVVMVIVSILAVTAVPALTGSVGMRDLAWHDAALGALRHARATALAHRRVVCLTFSGNTVSLTMASANPAVSCDATPATVDGGGVFASSANSAATTTVKQAGVAYAGALYFQPDGRVTTNLAGTSAGQWTITMTAAEVVVVDGVTGYAR